MFSWKHWCFLFVSAISFTSFSLLQSSSLCKVFDAVSPDADKLLSFNPSINADVLWDLNVHLADSLTYSSATDRHYNLSQSITTLLGLVTLLLEPLSVVHTLCLLDLFPASGRSVYSVLAFHTLKNSDHVFITVFIDFPISSNEDAPCHYIAFDYSVADGMVLVIISEMSFIWVPGCYSSEMFFNCSH